MTRNKIIPIILIIVLLASIQVMGAHAATGPSSPGTGSILSIKVDTNPTTKITTVLVNLLGGAGQAQQVRVSLETAISMGLVIITPSTTAVGQPVSIPNTDPQLTGVVKSLVVETDPVSKAVTLKVTLTVTLANGTKADQVVSLDLPGALSLGLVSITPDATKIGTSVVIDPKKILESSSFTQMTTKIGAYFGPALGVTFAQLAAYQKAGYGLGEITQACWMAVQAGGNATLLDQILTAKKTGNFSALVLPGGKTASNWGQLRKLLLTDPHQNLGSIMSGKATPLPTATPVATVAPVTTTSSTAPVHGNGNANSHGNGNGNGNGHGNGNGNGKHGTK
jgi:hypothetical protein